MDKVAIVTGTSSGIGFETAVALAKEGYHTFATMRDTSKGAELEDVIKKDNLSIEIIKLDVDDEKAIQSVIDQIIQKHK